MTLRAPRCNRARTPASPATDPVLLRLAALERRMDRFERQADRPADDDRVLMRALVNSVGGAVFSAGDLVTHATLDPALQAALRRYPTARSVGKRLRAIADLPIAGFAVRRVGRDNTGTIWGVVQVTDNLHADACSAEDAGA